MTTPQPRLLTVVRKRQLTPNMIRITLGGEDLRGFPEDQESGYVKLVFPPQGESELAPMGVKAVDRKGKRNRLRSYTIRAFDPQALQLDLDFVAHGDNGPASAWAMDCAEGDRITVLGPGPKKLVDMEAEWFFLAADMTALPALSVNLERMPRDARGYAVMEILEEGDRQEIDAPPGVEFHWVINPHPDRPNTVLADAVRALPWQPGRVNVWAACEFDTMRNLRAYFKKERDVGRGDVYASSYWKMGEPDEGNKAAKREDPEADL
ncbi:siderophore-interacting protein [Microbulbifer sp.]|uniref:siderophore-interacting protein n=1 Tax=Microbulbifer sp. TaxID=1908541 RepID=UPI003F37DA66